MISLFEHLEASIDREQYCYKLTKYFREFGLDKYEKKLENIFELLDKHGNLKQAIKRSKKLLKMHTENGEKVSQAKMKPATTVFILVEELSQYF